MVDKPGLTACRVPFVFVILVIAWAQFLLIRFYKVDWPFFASL